jgi:hypothetical protein
MRSASVQMIRSEPPRIVAQRRPRAGDRGEGAAQVVGDCAQKRAAHRLVARAQRGGLRLLGEPHPLDREGDLSREGLEEVTVRGVHDSGARPEE